MREAINAALQRAVAEGKKGRAATLRLIQATIRDRDAQAREAGGEGVGDDDVLEILHKMLKQREQSTREYEEAGQVGLAEQEREESDIIREFLPRQLSEKEVRGICEEVVRDINAHGLRDMGRCMNALKQRFPGQMDFTQASCVVKDLLRTH
ncbi:GatB/YqeY domain-containing protein [Stappia sp. F7233]|uniref:GatB/YqeY domain-containing protein n=1 Tax=Stappia albiluteola TaxID=2758565 RepID=A0A839AE99_9HYPH|nr:GatB/YqeY domain-containing protein [Stappia albiluteola]MBA5777881.1 GatB/YqeY domain-containing protein [Stappia albiluteola]